MPDPLREGDPARVGPYRLYGRLGQGGMGQVFLGRSRGGHAVAVKVARPELAGDEQFRRRFAAEVAAARKVGGFYTAHVVDADPDADPPWLASAYIAGPSLHRAVADHGPLPAESVAALGAGLAEGLAAVHACGLVHRDLKPANVILAQDGPRLIDFGIARALDATSYTQTSAVLGTAAFMSPEQATARPAGPESDVFSLGCVLAFAATGRSPFGEGPGHAVIYRIVHAEPDLAGVPEPLAGLVAACLAKDPAARPSTSRILEGLAGPPPPDGDGAGRGWLPEAVTEVVTRHRTRVATLLEPRPRPAAETAKARPARTKKPASGFRGSLPGSDAAPNKAWASAAGILVLVATVALLYVYPQPYSVWLSGLLSGGASGVDLRECATDVGGDLAAVPCWSPAAEYKVTLIVHWGRDQPGETHDPEEECEKAEGWVRAIEADNQMACLMPLR